MRRSLALLAVLLATAHGDWVNELKLTLQNYALSRATSEPDGFKCDTVGKKHSSCHCWNDKGKAAHDQTDDDCRASAGVDPPTSGWVAHPCCPPCLLTLSPTPAAHLAYSPRGPWARCSADMPAECLMYDDKSTGQFNFTNVTDRNNHLLHYLRAWNVPTKMHEAYELAEKVESSTFAVFHLDVNDHKAHFDAHVGTLRKQHGIIYIGYLAASTDGDMVQPMRRTDKVPPEDCAWWRRTNASPALLAALCALISLDTTLAMVYPHRPWLDAWDEGAGVHG